MSRLFFEAFVLALAEAPSLMQTINKRYELKRQYPYFGGELDICEGIQQCADEEGYRCGNGACIPAEYFLDDELDSQLVRLGVFNSNDESAAPESKFLIQAYDGIHNEPCGTGATKHVIVDGKLAIFGPSTGQRYAFNVRNFAQNIGNDGVLVRVSYLVMPHGGAKSISNRIPILMPNVLHIGVTIENVLL
ncbi:unnamed protein product [Rotaria socialis]